MIIDPIYNISRRRNYYGIQCILYTIVYEGYNPFVKVITITITSVLLTPTTIAMAIALAKLYSYP